MTSADNRPFTSRLERLRQRATLSDLARRSGLVRSTSWFQKLCTHSDPWSVHPPDRDAIVGLATLLSTTTERVNAMVAREWYGIETACLAEGVASLAVRIAKLDEEDMVLIELYVERLLREGEVSPPLPRIHSAAG
jgi:hypothetical protein